MIKVQQKNKQFNKMLWITTYQINMKFKMKMNNLQTNNKYKLM